MFEPGTYVADQVEAVTPDQVQPNGVDLTLGAVFEGTGPGRIDRDGTRVADRRELSPEAAGGTAVHRLDPGGYVCRYGEALAVPEGHVGFVYPRSSLLRNSCMLHTAVWDAGYRGVGEGLLAVHRPIELEPGARIAQFVLARADRGGTYDGRYQGEGIEPGGPAPES